MVRQLWFQIIEAVKVTHKFVVGIILCRNSQRENLTSISTHMCLVFPEGHLRGQRFMAALHYPSCLNCSLLRSAPEPPQRPGLPEAAPADKQKAVSQREQLNNTHWPKHHSSATLWGGTLKYSFTSSDFLCGPVAQVFWQDFAHVAVLWKQLNHLQASASCWKECKQLYNLWLKNSSTDFRTWLDFMQRAWQKFLKRGVLAPRFPTVVTKWLTTVSHTPQTPQ